MHYSRKHEQQVGAEWQQRANQGSVKYAREQEISAGKTCSRVLFKIAAQDKTAFFVLFKITAQAPNNLPPQHSGALNAVPYKIVRN